MREKIGLVLHVSAAYLAGEEMVVHGNSIGGVHKDVWHGGQFCNSLHLEPQ